jgi:type III secretory pathway lipoprotein EscJ
MFAFQRRWVWLALGLTLSACAGDVVFASELSFAEARALCERIEEAGVPASTRAMGEDGAYTVLIQANDVAVAVQSLQRPVAPQTPQTSILPSPNERRRAEERALARDLEALLSALPWVSSAHLQINLSQTRRLELTAPEPATVVTVITHLAGMTPAVDEAERLLVGAVPSLKAEHITVSLSPINSSRPSAARFIRVGPFRVHPAESTSLRWTLRCGAGLVSLLAVTIIYLVMRRRTGVLS